MRLSTFMAIAITLCAIGCAADEGGDGSGGDATVSGPGDDAPGDDAPGDDAPGDDASDDDAPGDDAPGDDAPDDDGGTTTAGDPGDDATTTTDPTEGASTYGLEWSGDGDVRSMLVWHDPFPIYDATYVFKVYPREKLRGDIKYYTTFFWGNDGTFVWDGGNANTYYGAHPYPIPAPGGPGQWEISVYANDFTTGEEVEWDRWYTQAFRAWRESDSITHHEFYWDLPDTSRVLTHTIDDPSWAAIDPPVPAIVIGQAPDYMGASWGGYPGWEEFNGIIRGVQIYDGLLSLDDIAAEIEAPESTAAGQQHIWYLNVDPRPDDVADKQTTNAPHHPSWDGVPAMEWMGE
jgi:hypothetical protein